MLAMGTRISVSTPTYFLLAMEDLEDVALQQAAAWTTAEKRRLDDDRCGDQEGVHLDKRLRSGVQDDGGCMAKVRRRTVHLCSSI